MMEATMKSKQLVGLLVVFIFGVSQLFAGGLYVKGQGGYAFGLVKGHVTSEYTYNSQGTRTSVKDIYHSYGKGLQGKGAIGLPITPNMALQVESGLSILGGLTTEQKYADGHTQTLKISAWHIPILAGIVISTAFWKKKSMSGMPS